jgi:hypothetical protein
LKYNDGGNQFAKIYIFGDKVKTDDFLLEVTLKENYDPNIDNRYFFTINTNESIVSYINKNLTVEPLDFKAKTITVSFKDYHRQKARDNCKCCGHALSLLYTVGKKQGQQTKNQLFE